MGGCFWSCGDSFGFCLENRKRVRSGSVFGTEAHLGHILYADKGIADILSDAI